MLVTSLVLGSVLLGATWALGSITLPEPVKLFLLGIALVGIAVWSRRSSKRQGNSQ